ncbi:MAG TPA: endopeptidase La [Syntrophorhabdus sp.]|jgi:ATP-dependent Lon protease|nr:endopeptidase La [Syntrophorhabdus sp.]OPX94148.1 MAG: Lon protease [Syntrophorhabdus sp. PtaB.Bin027]OQB76098.1 MAG: Lon protease [Deltaproteobacteria bacterium ADurb.Bin135]HNQ47238.1 endopeptidase La [Syntrophorhabdus sp.]HNS78612.1 endopeptidase La [Syntrophorhabdus sp.]
MTELEIKATPEVLPLLPVRDMVMYPSVILPLFVGRDMSINAVEKSLSKDRLILVTAQKDLTDEDPLPGRIYSVGVVSQIMRMLRLPDGRVKVLMQGLKKAKIIQYVQETPTFLVRIQLIEEPIITEITLEIEALMRYVKEEMEKVVSMGRMVPPDILMVLDTIDEPGKLADVAAANLGLAVDKAQEILEIVDPIERLKKLSEILGKEIELLNMQAKILSQAKEEMSKSQREYFLREQMKAIRTELGEGDERSEDVEDLRKRIKKAKMPKDIEKETKKQLERLDMMHPDAVESTMLRTYIEWLIELPWNKSTKDRLDIKKAKRILDEDHYDLDKVKERILEFLSVMKLKGEMKGPILCFVGPPGVGKTSLGKSIARSLGRKFLRISLGGMKDEAEIRGHRRTYVGSMPGRIIQGIKTAGTNNPVFMMDEIDKIGTDFRGDPSSALLEVLDPEQNNAFSDHYLNVPFDLSKVMFITTANRVDTIPSALKDRMETIYISGYTDNEKLAIAKKYLVPKQLAENGLTPAMIEFADKALTKIIQDFTQEAGLRNLEREIAAISRKVAKKIAEGQKEKTVVTLKNLHSFLGPSKYLPETGIEVDSVGIASGLAWTEFGGDVLYIEASCRKGKKELMLTGSMGDVMKESAQAALTYIKSKAAALGIEQDIFDTLEMHVHIPQGAIPKDGPSAGITMAVAMISAITKHPLSRKIAMTGEITLRGRVLPVGGLKEKTLAALRARIKKVILPEENMRELVEIPQYVKKKINFLPVKTMDDVIKIMFVNKTVG